MRAPTRGMRLAFSMVLAALAALACNNDGLPAPTVGALRIAVITTGGDPDLDGYTVLVDNSAHAVSANDTVVFTGLGTGPHAVRLSGVAPNCKVPGHNPGTDTSQVAIGQPSVAAGDTTDVAIAVACSPTGVLITTATIGVDRDSDGYTVVLDGLLSGVVASNGSVAITRLSADSHRVALGEVGPNCTIGAPHPRVVTVQIGQVAPVAFAVSCTAMTGAVRVTAASTGIDLDPNGYGVAIDGGAVRTVSANGAVTFDGIGAGDHTVTLSDVAENCTLSDANPASVHVSIGGATRDTARATFHLACISSQGTIKISTVTNVETGALVDPDGYTALVDNYCDYYYGCYYQWEAAVPVNGAAALTNIPMGDHTVTLSGVARNCVIDGADTRTVHVPPADTGRLTFTIACRIAGSIQVSVTTTGADLDPDGYWVRAHGATLDTTAALATNGTLTMSNLPPGSYTAELGGVSLNCDVTAPNPRAVTVAGGSTAAVAFQVACVAATPIAFASDAPGNTEIYTIRSDGTAQTRLTTAAARDMEPAWSPDRSRIAFRSERDGNAEIYVMNADGSNPVRLTTNPAADYEPAWSPDGTKIAFVSQRDGNAEVYVMNTDGTNPVRLTNDPSYDADPAWSPDGSKLAFTHGACDSNGCRGRIEVMNADGSGVVALTPGPGDLEPAWSPDGSKLVFARLIACDYYGCDHDLIVMGADGSAAATLLSGSVDETEPTWSPDGRKIAFTYGACDYYYGCYGGIQVVRADGSDVRTLLGGGFNPAWRP